MEKFPHLVQMHRQYGSRGLVTMSVSLDDYENREAVAGAEAFLKEQGAAFDNLLVKADTDAAFKQLGLIDVPAMLLLGRDGKLHKKFTNNDPDRPPFTPEEVAKAVEQLLERR